MHDFIRKYGVLVLKDKMKDNHKNKYQNKRSQITLFIIIGIVALMIIGVSLFFLSKANKVDLPDPGLEKEKERYYNFIDQCFKESFKEGVFLIGMQGGAIYDYQAKGGVYYRGPGATGGFYYGEYIIPYEYDGVIYNVSYGIVDSKKDGSSHPDIPEYPYGYNKLTKDPKVYGEEYVNTFGNYPGGFKLSPLCDYYGQNSFNIKGNKYSCINYDSKSKDDKSSVQEVLEFYIANKTSECMDRIEEEESFSNMNITKGDAVAKVLFGAKKINAELNFPVSLSGNTTMEGVEMEIQEYKAEMPVRIRQIYELAYYMIENDVNNIFFDIQRDSPMLVDCNSDNQGKESCVRDGMTVLRYRDVCFNKGLCKEGNYDDVIMIVDEKSLINSKSYIFQFAVENRAPALDIIRQDSPLPEGYSDFDFVIIANETIVIDPHGYDPDEDLYSDKGYMTGNYRYYMWKETYDDIFDYANCRLDIDRCKEKPQSFVRKIDETKNLWSSSYSYVETQRNATYTTSVLDMGQHNLKVEICDNENRCDFQILKILVVNPSEEGFGDVFKGIVVSNNGNAQNTNASNPNPNAGNSNLEGQVCLDGDCCVDGKIAKKGTQCFIREDFGCRNDNFLPVFQDSIKTIDDKGALAENNDVYSRKVVKYCSGESSLCNGEIKEDLYNYKNCISAKTCSSGNKDCIDAIKDPSSSCNENSDCFGPDEYMWSKKACYHSCSDSCIFSYTGITNCNAPKAVDGKKMVGGSPYLSSCMVGNTCYYGVSCTSSGIIPGNVGETCRLPGEKDGNACYISIGDIDNNCDDNGRCKNKKLFEGTCAIGSFSDGRCVSGNTCNYDISCTSTGWSYKYTDYILSSLGNQEIKCDSDCLNKGYKLDNYNKVCYYNIRCDMSKGWTSEKEYCHPNGLDGDTCWESYGCNQNGCTSEALPASMCD